MKCLFVFIMIFLLKQIRMITTNWLAFWLRKMIKFGLRNEWCFFKIYQTISTIAIIDLTAIYTSLEKFYDILISPEL